MPRCTCRRGFPTVAWRTSVPVYKDGKQVGYATSGCWSPLLKKYLALAHLQAPHGADGQPVEMEITVEHHRRRAGGARGEAAVLRPGAQTRSDDASRTTSSWSAAATTDWSLPPTSAKAGRRVLVLERRERVGGAAVSEQVFPGFTFSVFSYVVSLLRPEIIRDLELPRHGLQILPLESTVTPLPNGEYLAQWGDKDRTRRELARHSATDAEALDRFGHLMHHMAMAVRPLLGVLPPDPTSLSVRELRSLARARRPLPRARRAASPRARQAHDDELRGFPGRVVRVRAAEGHQVRERHHRHACSDRDRRAPRTCSCTTTWARSTASFAPGGLRRAAPDRSARRSPRPREAHGVEVRTERDRGAE